MKQQSKRFILLFAVLLIAFVIPVYAFDSATLATQTLKALPHCLHYRVRGFCVWLSLTSGFNTTPYLSHYSPDLVVTVFNKVGDDPWEEMKSTIDQVGKVARNRLIESITHYKAGNGRHYLSDKHSQSIFFKEADVIGNPALPLLPRKILLPSTAIPLRPYYQSMLDTILWRGLTKASFMEESASVVANLKYHVGMFPIDWGGLFPHEGFLNGTDEAIVSHVIALRAAHLLTLPTSLQFGHVVKTLSTVCGRACSAAPIEPNNNGTQLQRIYPAPENVCHVIGANLTDEVDQHSEEGAYAWILWRRYEGCVDGKGQFVSKVIF